MNWVEIHWDYIVCLPGRIGQIGWSNWSNWALFQWISTQFYQAGIQCNLNGFPPNSTRHHLNELGGQIGWKSIGITLYACLVKSVELGGQIGHHLNGFPPNLTRQAYNIISMDFHPIRRGRHTM